MIMGKGRRVTNKDCSNDILRQEFEDEFNEVEPWVEWMKRTTHEALDAIAKVGIPEWTEVQCRRAWRCAGHVMRRDDGRWTCRVLDWTPEGNRRRGHPSTRWIDAVNGFFIQLIGTSRPNDLYSFWRTTAQDRETWQKLENDYV
jgi:hypothetical protein